MTDQAADSPRPTTQPNTKHRLRVVIDVAELHRFLGLPDGFHVAAMVASNDPVSVIAVIEAATLPESPINAESPYAFIERIVDKSGHHVVEHRTLRFFDPNTGILQQIALKS